MALAALASGATHGIVYVRSEYPRARDALRAAVAEARAAAGRLGAGTGFDVEVFEGAGSYVAGEETSLIHSIEGLRGEVAVAAALSRPSAGFLHRPTVVNNVETLAAVPWIVDRGGAAYARLGVGDSRGTKVVCLNERFRRPGAYEVELGTLAAPHLRASSAAASATAGEPRRAPGRRAAGRLHRARRARHPADLRGAPRGRRRPRSRQPDRDRRTRLGRASCCGTSGDFARERELRHVRALPPRHPPRARDWPKRRRRPAPGPSGRDELLAAMEHGSLCAFGRGVPPVVREHRPRLPTGGT